MKIINIVKFIAYLLTGFALIAPEFGIALDSATQIGFAALGTLIVGLTTNGIGTSTTSIFTSVAGAIPALVWLVGLVFPHLALSETVWKWITEGIVIVIAYFEQSSDLPTFVKGLISTPLAKPPIVEPPTAS